MLARNASRLLEAERVVRPIVDDVRLNGDEAVRRYAQRFDQYIDESFVIPTAECEAALAGCDSRFRDALEVAVANVRAFAAMQLPAAQTFESAPGVRLGQAVRPLDSIAAYVPAGRYPLPSTLIMTVVPALVAGVRNICVTTPRRSPEVLAAAALLRDVQLFQIGGAHAIAAFAFGTATIPRVDRIVGPGNIYVAAAKRLVAGDVAIDFVAGPTEIVIIADDGNPCWTAADMLAQAEHDPDAAAILLTTSRSFADAVAGEVETQLEPLTTAETARAALERNSAIIVVDSIEQAFEISNRIAPEHLSISDALLLPFVQNAGSVFIGLTSPEAAGDYVTGPNHVLPTNGAARFRGGLSAADFVKVISTQQIDRDALRRFAPAITTLARAEGLEAHARSVEVRFDD